MATVNKGDWDLHFGHPDASMIDQVGSARNDLFRPQLGTSAGMPGLEEARPTAQFDRASDPYEAGTMLREDAASHACLKAR